MAGLIGLTSSDIELQDALRVHRWEFDGDWIPHPVVRLTTTLPAAVKDEEGPVIKRVRWGFPVGGGRPVGNARDDKLQESRLWGSFLGKSHGLFAATGIYEMVDVGGEKHSFWFRRRDGAPIVMPGLVGPRKVGDQERLCGAIVTTEPNKFFKQFHPRQVCALEGDAVHAWLNCDDPQKAMDLLCAPPADAWEAVPVDARIFAKGRRELDDLVPTGNPLTLGDSLPDAGQTTLFDT